MKDYLLERKTFKIDATKVMSALYRPFTHQWVYFDHLLNQPRNHQHHIFPTADSQRENRAIVVSELGYRAEQPSTLITNCVCDLRLCASLDGHQSFPFYVYDANGSNRPKNITDWALQQFRERCHLGEINKADVFYYVYGLLHHPGYREKFADNLKRDPPRIPSAPDFMAFKKAGAKLAELHLGYEGVDPYKLGKIEASGVPLSYRVEKLKLTKDKTAVIVNSSLTPSGIPAEAFEYRLGNRSALEWVIDQYQVTEDKTERNPLRSQAGRRSRIHRPSDRSGHPCQRRDHPHRERPA